jgi:hypothetical protein
MHQMACSYRGRKLDGSIYHLVTSISQIKRWPIMETTNACKHLIDRLHSFILFSMLVRFPRISGFMSFEPLSVDFIRKKMK